MDRLSKKEMESLLNEQSQPKMTLFLPTVRAGSEIQQNPIRFKNLLRQAEEHLCDHGLRRAEAQAFLEPAEERLLTDETFWQQQSESLALFASPELFKYYRLPLSLDEMVMVGSQFYVLPLFELFEASRSFYVLALSQDSVRLLEGTKYHVEEVDIEGVPPSLAEALKWDDPEKQTQYHTTGDGFGGGEQGRADISFHGHGVGQDDEKRNILRFFQKVDRGLKDFLSEEKVPLVLAGVDYLFPIYREANSYHHLVEQGIPGNPEEVKNETLQAQAWELLEPIFEQEQKEAISLYVQQAGMNTGRTSKNVEIIVPAAYEGRVSQLFAREGAEIWGYYDLSSNQVEIYPERKSGSEELINTTAIFAFQNGGDIYNTSGSEIPDQPAVAAIFRY